MALSALSVCTGGGGLDLGVELACPGVYRTLCYVEREASAVTLLAARFQDQTLPEAPVWSDVRTLASPAFRAFVGRCLRGEQLGILYGGIPCQPWSVAGKREGTEDERDLWPATRAALRAYRPRLFFLENVRGFIRGGLGLVIRDIADLGYRYTYDLFSAAEVGASHRRERVFLLAYHDSIGFVRGQECDIGTAGGQQASRRGDADGRDMDVGDTDSARREKTGSGHRLDAGRQSEPGSRDVGVAHVAGLEERVWAGGDSGTSQPTSRPDTGEAMPLFPPGPNNLDAWRAILAIRPDLAPAIESGLCRVADGASRGMDLSRADRLRILGNGVVPLTAALAFSVLAARLGIEHMKGTSCHHDTAKIGTR